MLSEFLKSTYKSKVLLRSNIQIPNWIVSDNLVQRKFKCDNFQSATFLLSALTDYLSNRNTNFSIMNVYDQVEVTINGDITERDIHSIKTIDSLYKHHYNLIDNVVKSDLSVNSLPKRLELHDNNQELETNYKLHGKEYFKEDKLKLL